MTSHRGQGPKKNDRKRQAEAEWTPPISDDMPAIEAGPTVGHVEVPLAPLVEGSYLTMHVEVVLDHTQAAALQRARNGLDRENACLENGKRIVVNPDVIKYLLEQLVN